MATNEASIEKKRKKVDEYMKDIIRHDREKERQQEREIDECLQRWQKQLEPFKSEKKAPKKAFTLVFQCWANASTPMSFLDSGGSSMASALPFDRPWTYRSYKEADGTATHNLLYSSDRLEDLLPNREDMKLLALYGVNYYVTHSASVEFLNKIRKQIRELTEEVNRNTEIQYMFDEMKLMNLCGAYLPGYLDKTHDMRDFFDMGEIQQKLVDGFLNTYSKALEKMEIMAKNIASNIEEVKHKATLQEMTHLSNSL